MSSPAPPVTPEQIAALPPEFQALLQSVIDHYERRIAGLEAEIATLKKTPRNSSLPPSAEHPHAKPVPVATFNRRQQMLTAVESGGGSAGNRA